MEISEIPQPGAKNVNAEKELEQVRRGHDAAYIEVAQGLTLEETGKHSEAIPHYAEGLKQMDQALAVRCDGGHCVGAAWDRARTKQEKMRRIHKVLEDRLSYLNAAIAAKEQIHDEGLRQFAQDLKATPPTYADLELHEEFLEDEPGTAGGASEAGTPMESATELFCIPSGVQVFFVSPEGHVSAPSSPAALKILRLDRPPPNGVPNCSTFLQIGTYTYPLMPGQSPSLHADYGAYMLPDLSSDVEGACVGIILGASISSDAKKQFSDLMKQLTVMKEAKVAEVIKAAVPEAKVDTLKRENAKEVKEQQEAGPGQDEGYAYQHRYSKKILQGAELIVWAIHKGSEKVNIFVREHSVGVKEKITPNGEPLIQNPLLIHGIKFARVASGWTYKISKKAVKQVGHVSLVIARYLAPKITASVESALPRSWTVSGDSNGHSKIDHVYEVGGAGVQGVAMVYLALDSAAHFLAAGLIDETVQIVNLKWGEAAADAAHAGGNVVMTGMTLRNLGPKGIAKKAAKHTGQIMFEDWRDSKKLKGQATVGATAQNPSVTFIPTRDEELPPSDGAGTSLYPKF
ncbi:putative Spartin [Hypsibius exemplaris]|uniref:Spartin n=1 Tax=Hypsibius exemplaris TaxID=2072580 RepID=A0A1W0X119_HYPEX|nr:putative Spartin [Hypsibius exemplaris]